MAFVREVIPEEYLDMLKELGVDNERTPYKTWIADKERGIYLWATSFGIDRDDPNIYYILIWQNAVVYLTTRTLDFVKDPTWTDDRHSYLQKGLINKEINKMSIPKSLASQGKALIEVIRDVFQNSDYRYDIELTHIAMPEVREED